MPSTAAHRMGRFVSWTGGSLLIGRNLSLIPEHSHYAIEIAFGETTSVRFRTNEQWSAYSGAIVPSRQPHAMDATEIAMSAALFIEPETPQGRALTTRYLQHGIAALPQHVLDSVAPSLFSAARGGSDDLLIDACRCLVQALTGDVYAATITDERVTRAIAYIKGNLHVPLTLDMVASEACLSPGRFRHLFVEETGMALRPYLLWRRFVRVWELLAGGTSLSTAAHAAGFADASHLSRTSRSMFGFPPSALHIERAVPAPVVQSELAAVSHRFTTRTHMQPLRTTRTGYARYAPAIA